jgi:hypothetical protein
MTILAPSPTPGPFDQDQLRPNAAFFADYSTGSIDAFTGQTATFTRSGTQSIVASQGTYTIGDNQPRLEWVQGQLGYVPTASTLFYSFNQRTVFPTRIHATVIRTSDTSGVIARIGGTASALGTLTLEQNGARYRLVYTTYANEVSSIQMAPTLPLNTRIDLIATADLSDVNNVTTTLSWRTTGAYSFIGSLGDTPTIADWSAAQIHVGSLAGSSVPGSTIRALLVTYNSGLLRPWRWA